MNDELKEVYDKSTEIIHAAMSMIVKEFKSIGNNHIQMVALHVASVISSRLLAPFIADKHLDKKACIGLMKRSLNIEIENYHQWNKSRP